MDTTAVDFTAVDTTAVYTTAVDTTAEVFVLRTNSGELKWACIDIRLLAICFLGLRIDTSCG